MLQTPAIKADQSTATAASSKEKDSSALSLEVNFSAYFSQMVSALPSIQASVPAQAPAAPPAPVRRASNENKPAQTTSSTPSAAAAAATAAAGSAAQAAGNAQAPGSPQTPSAPQDPDAASSSSSTASASSQSQTAGATPAAAAATAAPAPGNGGAPLAKAAPAADPAALAPAAPAADTPSGANAKGGQDQPSPGGRLQIQVEGDPAPATTKAPLTELVNQIQMDTNTSAAAEKASLPAAAPPAPAAVAPAAVPDVAAALQALQTVQAPQLAGQTALLAMPAGEPASAIGTGLAVNAAAAQAVSAGAQPGASGSVRVTASAQSGASLGTEQQSILSQVDGTIKFLVKNQDQSAELQLHPESLGRVQITLKVEGNVVHAKVWASEAAAVPVLQDHRAYLEASLKNQGLTLGSFDLQHGHRQQQAPLPTPADPAPAPAISLALPATGQETPMSMGPAAIHTSRIEYVA